MHEQNKIKKTTIGVELVRLLVQEGKRIFSTDEARALAPSVGLNEAYLAEVLYRLRRNGWILPLHRGLYAVSSQSTGITPIHEFEIAMALVSPAAISHWSALHHHGLTQQMPRQVYVLTTTQASVPRANKTAARPSRGYTAGDFTYQFIRIKAESYFGTESVWAGQTRVMITDLERTLLDGLSNPKHCGDFAEVLQAFQESGSRLNLEKIIAYALKLDAAVTKRLGWVLEQQGVSKSELEPLAARPVKGYRLLDSSGPQQGFCNRRWMIQENLAGKVAG